MSGPFLLLAFESLIFMLLLKPDQTTFQKTRSFILHFISFYFSLLLCFISSSFSFCVVRWMNGLVVRNQRWPYLRLGLGLLLAAHLFLMALCFCRERKKAGKTFRVPLTLGCVLRCPWETRYRKLASNSKLVRGHDQWKQMEVCIWWSWYTLEYQQ